MIDGYEDSRQNRTTTASEILLAENGYQNLWVLASFRMAMSLRWFRCLRLYGWSGGALLNPTLHEGV